MQVDFAPGQSHIVRRTHHCNFYSPELFYLSPFYNKTVTILIRDILNGTKLNNIYGSRTENMNQNGWFMVKNHPIWKIKIRGMIKSLTNKEFDDQPRKNFILLTMDDSSDIKSTINVKVPHANFFQSGLSLEGCEGRKIEVVGVISRFLGMEEVIPHSITILNSGFDVELDHWKEALEVRQLLKQPWVYHNNSPYQSLQPPCVDRSHISYKPQEVSASPEVIEISDSPEVIEVSPSSPLELANTVDDDLIIMESKPVKLVNDFQIILEILKFLLVNKCKPIKLIEIYNNPKINKKLNDFTIIKMDNCPPIDTEKDFLNFKYQNFHNLRHKITDLKLITTTKHQIVNSDELYQLGRSIQLYLNEVKTSNATFAVENYVRIYKMQCNIGNIDKKLINGIIEWFIEDERDEWKYDKKRTEWYYMGKLSMTTN